MYWAVYVFLGLLATLTSYAAISRRVDPRLGAPPAVVLWWIWAFASFNVVYRGPSNIQSDAYSSLAVVGAVAGVIMLVFAAAAILGRLAPLAETRYAPAASREAERDPKPDATGQPATERREEPSSGRQQRSPFAPED